MFERFSKSAVLTVHATVAEAHQDPGDTITEEHLVYGLFREPSTAAATMCGDTPTIDELREGFAAAHRRGGLAGNDIDSLRELGIEIDEVVNAVEQQLGDNALAPVPVKSRRGWFGKRHLPFSDGLKLTLEGALQEARKRGDRNLDDTHLLLSLLDRGGMASGVLAEFGVTYQEIEARIGRPQA